jgi:hypothetical protein
MSKHVANLTPRMETAAGCRALCERTIAGGLAT